MLRKRSRGIDTLAKRLADGGKNELCVAKPDSAKSVERELQRESEILGGGIKMPE